MSLLQEFNKLKTDKEKWKWLMTNQGKGLVVMLDNDDTFVVDENDEETTGRFNEYIGWSDGVQILLDVIGIQAECV